MHNILNLSAWVMFGLFKAFYFFRPFVHIFKVFFMDLCKYLVNDLIYSG